MAKRLQKKNRYIKPTFWRRLLAFWTFLSIIVVIADFITRGGMATSLVPVLIIYVAVLSAYSAEKEFRRWHDYHSGRHPGELYVLLWTILLAGIFIVNIALGRQYEMPDAVVSTYIVTLGILIITRSSKAALKRK